MNTFTKGVLAGVGIGVSVGLLVAPLSGKETRRMFAERVTTWLASLPEDSRLNQYASQVSDQVTATRENVRGYTQQAVFKAKETGAALSSRARQTGQEVTSRAKETGQDMASKVLQTVGFTSSSTNGANRRAMPEE